MRRESDSMAAPTGSSRWVEPVLGLLILGCFAYQAWFLATSGYLGQPFFYDTLDTLMDFHHTAYWSHSDGPYTVWGSIYPPLSFAVLKLVTPAQCYAVDPFIGRTCYPVAVALLLMGMLALAVVVWRASASEPFSIRASRVVLVTFGLPALFGLERGNLVLWAVPAMVWALQTPRSGWLQAFALAWAINLKPYLLIVWMPLGLTQGWRSVARPVAATTVVYGLSVIAVGDGLPWHLLDNMRSFVGDGAINYWEKIYYSTSLSPMLRTLQSELPISQYMDSQLSDLMEHTISRALAMTACLSVLAMAAVLLVPRSKRPQQLLVTHMVALALCMTEALGGYTTLLLVALLVLLPANAESRTGTSRQLPRQMHLTLVVVAYVLSLPIDHIVILIRESGAPIWLTGLQVEIQHGISIGQGLRPALIVLATLLLSTALLRVSWKHLSVTPALHYNPDATTAPDLSVSSTK
jgi:hypothetical protein